MDGGAVRDMNSLSEATRDTKRFLRGTRRTVEIHDHDWVIPFAPRQGAP